jgi:flagellar hook protein FlgE
MLRSLFTGISGMRTHQQMMDVTGNNIANVNTAGYKTSTAVFQDTLSQMLKPAGAPQGANGGTNPAQIGLGVGLSGVSTNFSQGSAQVTGRSTDLMINGDGFFVLGDGDGQLFSRAGSFSFDSDGRLVNPNGKIVQGWNANNGVIDPNAPLQGVQIPMGTPFPPKASTEAFFSGNLAADSVSTTPITTGMKVYDDQGNETVLTLSFTKNGANNWGVSVTDGTNTTTATLDFAATNGGAPDIMTVTLPRPAPGADIVVDLSRLSSFAGDSTLTPQRQNGSSMGALNSFSISADGSVVGVFSNGLKQTLAQVAVASFSNPPGLEKVGDSMYRTTVNSRDAAFGIAGSGGRGQLQGGALEMSNVDLGQEFANLIVAQRGFQANSKVISTSDELLQDLVNLKR